MANTDNLNRALKKVRRRSRIPPPGWYERRIAKQFLILRKLLALKPNKPLEDFLEEFHGQISL